MMIWLCAFFLTNGLAVVSIVTVKAVNGIERQILFTVLDQWQPNWRVSPRAVITDGLKCFQLGYCWVMKVIHASGIVRPVLVV